MTHPSGGFHRCTGRCPSATSAGSTSSVSVRCRFHTCRPAHRGLAGMEVTAPSVHAVPCRCGFRAGSGRGRARNTRLIQSAGDPRDAVPDQPLREDPRHHVRGIRIRFQAVRAAAPCGVRLVRVQPTRISWSCIHEEISWRGRQVRSGARGETAPLGRVGQVSDVADGILYLESAPYVTGEILHIDGGRTAGH
jgi:Enoyl-(Acyl carrier protein) reductase